MIKQRKINSRIIIGIIAVVCAAILLIFSSSCSSCGRACKDMGSDISGGLNRDIVIYNFNGEVMKTYSGKIDLEHNESGVVKFDLDGKRYMYYNAIVEVIEK